MLEYGLAFFAGVLSILSPCVLPMLPIIIASSLQAAPRYILLLPLGLATCFTLLGVGSSFLLNATGIATFELQKVAAAFFVMLGLILIFSAFGDYFQKTKQNTQNFLQKIIQPIHQIIDRLNVKSPIGQFMLGFLLAMTWSPCIGPTLGVAMSLAASGENLIHAAFTMFLYSLGISIPFVLLIYLGKRYRLLQQRINQFSGYFKIIFGMLILIWGVMVLMEWDKSLSTMLLNSNISNSVLNAK
jgi:cytochrome c-type biogenesis protein